MKGMDKFLDVEAESSDGGDSDDDNTDDDAVGVEDVTTATGGDNDTCIRSPSPKRYRTTRGEPARKRKKTVDGPFQC